MTSTVHNVHMHVNWWCNTGIYIFCLLVFCSFSVACIPFCSLLSLGVWLRSEQGILSNFFNKRSDLRAISFTDDSRQSTQLYSLSSLRIIYHKDFQTLFVNITLKNSMYACCAWEILFVFYIFVLHRGIQLKVLIRLAQITCAVVTQMYCWLFISWWPGTHFSLILVTLTVVHTHLLKVVGPLHAPLNLQQTLQV